jgi:hypothetical protein
MDLTLLIKFVEHGEHRRIKSGILQYSISNFKVKSGKAIGSVQAVYNDLSVAVLNNNTGSEKGIFDRISSFIGNTFIIRGSNLPGKSGKMKTGKINYKRKSDDYFLQYVWFALRSGVGDLVGF